MTTTPNPLLEWLNSLKNPFRTNECITAITNIRRINDHTRQEPNSDMIQKIRNIATNSKEGTRD